MRLHLNKVIQLLFDSSSIDSLTNKIKLSQIIDFQRSINLIHFNKGIGMKIFYIQKRYPVYGSITNPLNQSNNLMKHFIGQFHSQELKDKIFSDTHE